MLQAVRVRDGKRVDVAPNAICIVADKDWSGNVVPFCYDMWSAGSDKDKLSNGTHIGFDAFGRSSYTAGRSVSPTQVARASTLGPGAEVFADLGRTKMRGKDKVTIYDRVVIAGRDPSVGSEFLEQRFGHYYAQLEEGPLVATVRIMTGPKGDVAIDLPGTIWCVPMDVDWYRLVGPKVRVQALPTPGRVLVLGQGYGWSGCVWRIGRVRSTLLRDGMCVPSGGDDDLWVPAMLRGR